MTSLNLLVWSAHAQSCVSFTNLCTNPFVPTSVTREGTWTYPPAAVYFRSRAEYTTLGVLRNAIPLIFSADFGSCLVARSRKRSNQMRAKDPFEKIQACSTNSPQKKHCSSWNSQQWHPRRRVDDWLSNSYRPGLSKSFGRGPHKLLQNNSRAGHLA